MENEDYPYNKTSPNNYQSAYQNLFFDNSQNRYYKLPGNGNFKPEEFNNSHRSENTNSNPSNHTNRSENFPRKPDIFNNKSENPVNNSYNKHYNSYNKPIVPIDNQASKDLMYENSYDEFRDMPLRSLRPVTNEDEQIPLERFDNVSEKKNRKNFEKKLNRSLQFDELNENQRFSKRKLYDENVNKRGLLTEKVNKSDLDELFDEILERRFESLKKQKVSEDDRIGYREIKEELHEENCLNCQFCGRDYIQDESFFRNLLDTTELAVPLKTLNAEILNDEEEEDEEGLPDRTLNVDYLE